MKNNKIKMLVMDVDGTITDGKIYMGEHGEIMKAFNIKDGYAIREILPNNNILPVLITGRMSKIAENRALELGIIHFYQGIADKKSLLKNIVENENILMSNVAFIGDDINDLECMMNCGLIGCPADAAPEVKKIADFICKKKGGEGAVREFIEAIIKVKYRFKKT